MTRDSAKSRIKSPFLLIFFSIFIIALIIAVILIFILPAVNPSNDSTETNSLYLADEIANHLSPSEENYDDVCDEFKSHISSSTSDAKIWAAISYIDFLKAHNDTSYNYTEAISLLEQIEITDSISQDAALSYYVTLRNHYQHIDRDDKADYYDSKVDELTPSDNSVPSIPGATNNDTNADEEANA